MEIYIYLGILNLVTFMTYGIDKYKAKKKKWRISEFTLLLLSVTGGSLGAFLGMYCFHHKTKHLKFKIIVPLSLLIHIFLLIYFKVRI